MANFAKLIGAPNKADLNWSDIENPFLEETDKNGSHLIKDGWGPILAARYCIPLFWLCAFCSDDAVEVKITTNFDEKTPISQSTKVYCTTTDVAIQRINEHRARLLLRTPEQLRDAYSKLVDSWSTYLRANFPSQIILEPSEIAMMGDDREIEAAMDAISNKSDAFDMMNRGPITKLSASPTFQVNENSLAPFLRNRRPPDPLEWRCNLFGFSDDDNWPPEPTDLEFQFANNLENQRKSDEEAKKKNRPQLTFFGALFGFLKK